MSSEALVREEKDPADTHLAEHPILDGEAGKVSEPLIELNQFGNIRMAAIHRNGKIKAIQELAEVLKLRRAENKKIVHCHGVFDLLHIGHIRHLEQARKMGDILVVTVTPDRYVDKGPDRPAFTETLRAEAIASLSCTDYVAINKWPTAVETVTMLRPHFYVKGSEYAINDLTGNILREEKAVKSVGGRIVFTNDVTFSSSSLINKYLPSLPEEVCNYLYDFRKRYKSQEIIRFLEGARLLKVLVVGEAIVDEYEYCEVLGKSGKEPVLVGRYLSKDAFAGGVLAIANHVAGFCDQVGLLTCLGEQYSREDFVRSNLKDNVKPMFLYKKDSPTITKRRYVERYLMQKLFEVYEINDDPLSDSQNSLLCAKLNEILPDFDVVIVSDYGHGVLTKEVINVLCGGSRFLAVNTQLNAGNQGFNTISKYTRADYVCLSQPELLLETRNRDGDLESMIVSVAEKLNCDRVVVTRGRFGSVSYHKSEGFAKVPAFTHHVEDRVGAGDSVLSITSLCAAQEAPAEVMGFVGNVVGAEAVNIICNKRSIERIPLMKHIEHLLK